MDVKISQIVWFVSGSFKEWLLFYRKMLNKLNEHYFCVIRVER